MILVAGATGLLGSEICRRLDRQGEAIRAMVRPDSPRRSGLPPGTETVEADFKDVLSLQRSCRGISTVISTVNSVARRIGGDSLETVDRTGQKQLVRAARAAGVARFVYVSVSPGSADCPFVRVKREVEEVVRESGMEWVILQPTAFMEIWLSPHLGWQLSRRRVRVFGDGRKRTSFVSLEDVAEWAVVAALARELAGRVLPLCGPDPLSPLEIVRMAEEVTGRTFRVRHIPLPLVKAAPRRRLEGSSRGQRGIRAESGGRRRSRPRTVQSPLGAPERAKWAGRFRNQMA